MWDIQDKLPLTPEEEHAIELKRDLVAGQERVVWNSALPLPPKEFYLNEVEIARLKAALETMNSHSNGTDRGWLQPLLDAIISEQACPS